MTGTVSLTHHYEAPADQVWRLATDFSALERVCAGMVSFRGLPEGRCETGQIIDVDVSLFGRLPWQPYRMDVVECDDTAMRLHSLEKGSGVKSWEHRMAVDPDGDGSVLRDEIRIDAGLLTPVFCWWARKLYGARHEPRLRMLASGEFA